MIITTELLAQLSQATRVTVPPGTEMEIPDGLVPTVSFGSIPVLHTNVVGRTFSDSFFNDAQIDQTNVAASSRMLLALSKGLWRLTWFWHMQTNFIVTMGDASSLCVSQDNGVTFNRFTSTLGDGANFINRQDRGSFTVLVGNTNLQIIEFESATTGVGNRGIWTSGFYGEKLA